MDNAAGSKRTRSQTTLDSFSFVNLARSPLKQARSALRQHSPNHSKPHAPAAPPAPPPTATDTPSSSHATSSPDGLLKRPPSPAKDAALTHERDAKRPRHDIFPKKPSASLSAVPDDPRPHNPSSAYRRAVSVPPISSSVPLLDLNNVPPSPRRSPTKFRIASVPPEQPPSPPPHPPPLTLDLVPSIPAPEDAPTRSPLSPLSPLPRTDDESMPLDPIPAPSTSAPDKPSRLPTASLVSRMKPKQTAPPKKPRHPRSTKSVAPTVRMTRSASLRQKKVEEEVKVKANRTSPLWYSTLAHGVLLARLPTSPRFCLLAHMSD
ncbi:hypothetical protein OH77DRAFT_1525266 [Trametes cingulata]|nr:hypothetical protein OH77DRAFT_1525266 [Trametes cingulata]